MLDQLQMAIRRYEQIAPSPGCDMTLSQADQLADWLERQVSGITASLLTRPSFRRRVQWPIERLTGEIDCPEREAVIAVASSLLRFAAALQSLAKTDAISQQLLRLGPHGEEVRMGDPRALDGTDGTTALPPRPLGLQGIEFIASRPWRDLASSWDYFHPTSQLNLTESDDLEWAHFLPYVNRQLRVPGDFITRCMEIRVDHWRGILHRFFIRWRRTCARASPASGFKVSNTKMRCWKLPASAMARTGNWRRGILTRDYALQDEPMTVRTRRELTRWRRSEH